MPNVVYDFKLSDKFSAPAKRVAKAVGKIGTKFKRLDGLAARAGKSVGKSFAFMGRKAKGLATRGMGPLIAAVASLAAVTKFFSIGSTFEDALADLSAITGTTGDALKVLSDESIRLAGVSRVSAAEVVTAFKLVASAKSELLKDPKALSILTEQVLLLKNATGITTVDAARFTVGALNQFGEGADQASRFVNVLAASAKIGAAEVSDVGQALKNVGSVAVLAGLSFEQTNAAIQVLGRNNIKGAESGTKLRAAMIRLNTQIPFAVTGGFAESLEKLASFDLNFGQLTKFFGEEAVTAGAILIKNVPLLRQWTQGVTGTSVATDQAATRLATLSAEARGVGVKIQNSLIKVFERLTPLLGKQIDKFDMFFDSITTEDIDNFAARAAETIKVLTELGKVVVELGGIITALNPVLVPLLKLTGAVIGGVAAKVSQVAGVIGSGLDLVGLGGDDVTVSGSTTIDHTLTTRAEVDITLRAPAGTVESVQQKTGGRGNGMRVGFNMETAPAT